MKLQANITEILRLLRNLIRTGVIVEVNTQSGRCRVQTGGVKTDWLQWLTLRAGSARTWWAPSVGEQVILLAVGGNWIPPLCCRPFTPMNTRRHRTLHRHVVLIFQMGRSSSTSQKPVR